MGLQSWAPNSSGQEAPMSGCWASNWSRGLSGGEGIASLLSQGAVSKATVQWKAAVGRAGPSGNLGNWSKGSSVPRQEVLTSTMPGPQPSHSCGPHRSLALGILTSCSSSRAHPSSARVPASPTTCWTWGPHSHPKCMTPESLGLTQPLSQPLLTCPTPTVSPGPGLPGSGIYLCAS